MTFCSLAGPREHPGAASRLQPYRRAVEHPYGVLSREWSGFGRSQNRYGWTLSLCNTCG